MNKKNFFTILLVLVLVLSCSILGHAINYQTVENLIHTKNVDKIKEAIVNLDDHLKLKPTDGEALWLIAKAHLYLGDRVSENKLEIFETGKAYAEVAVENLPESPHPYFWQASLIGRIGQTRGILSSLFMVRPMKNALEQTLQLDENYADAYWVLSQLYHQAPGFPISIGSKQLALESAEKAVELDALDLEYQIQLAVALEYNGRKQEAINILEDLLKNPALNQDPELKLEVDEHYADFTKSH